MTSSSINNLNVKNTPVQGFSINGATGLTLDHITIDNTAGDVTNGGHNTDAFDVGSSDGITISNANIKNQDDCPFCVAPARSDEESLIVYRGRTSYVVLNLFPYNPGHLLVCPYRHVSLYVDLTDAETAEFTALTKAAIGAIDAASAPHGYNIGMNQGGVAGAGVQAHLHQHVVPRWGGDTNFMPVVGRTKVLPQLLRDTRQLLADSWPTD